MPRPPGARERHHGRAPSSQPQPMKIDPGSFRVPAAKPVDLKQWPTCVKPLYHSKKAYKKRLEQQVEELSDLQRRHYASRN